MPYSHHICGIYCIQNTKTNKRYIGQSVDIYERWSSHRYCLRLGIHNNQYLQNAWNKYGEKAFIFTVIRECNEADLDATEEKLINQYKTTDKRYGYNIEPGAIGGHRRTEETRIKIAKNRIYNVSAETRLKISNTQKGRRLSDEWKHNISLAHKKSIQEGRFKPKVINLLNYNNSMQKRIDCFDKEANFINQYKSIQEAGRILHLPATNICKVLKNKYKTCGGYCFSYSNS